MRPDFRSSSTYEVLKAHLIPRLVLPDVQSLRGTCTAFRSSVDSLPSDTWTSIVRQTLPEDHPLCLVTPGSEVSHHADRLARLHSSLRAGSGKQLTVSLYDSPHAHGSRGLDGCISPQGTFAVSEREYNVYLHKLLPGPLLELQQIAKLPCPEPATEHKENHSAAATWAPDESSVLLRYTICDYLDERGQWNANQWFEVLYLLDIATQEFRLVTTTYDILTMSAVRYFLGGHMIVFWEDCTDNMWRCDVHAVASLDRVATFKPQGIKAYDLPSMASLAGDRLAIAAPGSFEVFRLPSGQSEGRGTPPDIQPDEGIRAAGLISLNGAGTKLAFQPAGCSDIFLFDSRTLVALDTVHLEGHSPPRHPYTAGRKVAGLVWSPYSWMLTDFPIPTASVSAVGQRVRHLRAFRRRAGSSSCPKVLQLLVPLQQAPACSPDGAFLAMCTPHDGGFRVDVLDVRSGEAVLTQAVRLQEADEPQAVQQRLDRRDMAVWWSPCGFRILVRATSVGGRLLDHLTLVQL